jgi:hypothetical protein
VDGRDFLPVAQELAAGTTEPHWRAAVGRAYYALFLEAREALLRWGVAPPPRQNAHPFVRLKFTYATDPDLQRIGDALDQLIQWRNQADYNLASAALFASNANAVQAIGIAENAIALLDSIEADPARRTKAIASLPP